MNKRTDKPQATDTDLFAFRTKALMARIEELGDTPEELEFKDRLIYTVGVKTFGNNARMFSVGGRTVAGSMFTR